MGRSLLTQPNSPVTDPRVDRYIETAPEFAQPILRRVRQWVHVGCPGVVETMKWSRPSFLSHGRLMCGMAAFKAHCSFHFWHPEIAAHIAQEHGNGEAAAGQFGRITRLADLPDKATVLHYVAEAARLNATGKAARPSPAGGAQKPEIALPKDFAALLEVNRDAGSFFANLSRSARREYLEWIVDAKREATRARRMATAIEWLAAGKTRNWKYEAC